MTDSLAARATAALHARIAILEAEQNVLAFHAQGQAERIEELENHMDSLMITAYEQRIAELEAQQCSHTRLLERMQQAMTPGEWFDWQYTSELPERWRNELAAAQAAEWTPVADGIAHEGWCGDQERDPTAIAAVWWVGAGQMLGIERRDKQDYECIKLPSRLRLCELRPLAAPAQMEEEEG